MSDAAMKVLERKFGPVNQPDPAAQPPAPPAPASPDPGDGGHVGEPVEPVFRPPVADEPAQPSAAAPAPAPQPPAAPDPNEPAPVRQMRQHILSLEQQLAETKAKVAHAAPVDVTQSEPYKALKAEREQLAEQLSRLGLEFDPRFKARFEQPRNEIVAQVAETLKQFDVTDEQLPQRLLGMNVKQRVEAMKDLLPEVRQLVIPMLSQADSLEKQRQAALQNHRVEKQNLEAVWSQRQQEQAEAARKKIMASAMDELAKDHIIFRENPTDEEWNKNVQALSAEVLDVASGKDAAKVAKAIALGSAARIYLGWYNAERMRSKELEAKLRALQGDPPVIGDRGSPAPSQPQQQSPAPMTGREAARAARERAQQQAAR